ncbi:DNA topoisomerase 3 [Muribaculum intestinale]|uniref:DNA topoisomerase 3 n=1 Tax=Muribaculum intestinale TaxID=1796646 RepID=UPI002432FD3B|nr:DNA topoisomerase 3 [Muribaculum intestinale]
MKVCITEKPSVAKDIAAILGADVKRDGYYEGAGYRVTWTFGHLCTLKEPADYTDLWKRWSLGALPMLPQRFGIKLIPDAGIERQFNVIRSLIAEADEVINCGDAGQEGELIQRWVMQLAETRCPVRRLWISSLTDESIREGFRDLKPQRDYDRLYHAGLSRAIGDWILGMNGTRLYSLKYSSPGNVLSIGRVQTPTLALIVQRQNEIDNFTPQDYWELKTVYRDATFSAVDGRFKTEDEAQAVVGRISAVPLVIRDVADKKGREAPPRLFDLTSLQVECNRKWGWTADDTLKTIQSLYEKKVTTYPRVDTTYLSDDIYPKVPDIMRRMTPYARWTEPVLAAKLPKSKKVFDNSKVTDHHAIIPTGQSPSALVGRERDLYHLVAMRFIAAFYPDCQFRQTTVMADAADVAFKATGKVIESPGWRALFADKDKKTQEQGDASGGESADGILPPFVVGESGPHTPSATKKQTQPPKLYTEGTLLRAMESAGKTVDDEDLREAMKENGIGRPSTRAAIIETLFKRHYIARKGKSITALPAGIELIATINEELLKSAKLTGLWENKLRRIERGEFSAAEFIAELKELMVQIVHNVLSDNSMRRIDTGSAPPPGGKSSGSAEGADGVETPKPPKPRAPRIKSIEEIACPLCGEGHLLKGRTAYGCSRFREGCTLRLDFAQYPQDATPGRLRDMVKKNFSKKQTK